jgi:hypothetical protein
VKVFFTTEQSLLSEDGDATNDLYEAEVALGEPGSQTAHLKQLVMVSHGEAAVAGKPPTADGDGADVLGVARVSPGVEKGSREAEEGQEVGSHVKVFYVADGVLTDVANSEGNVAEEGKPNLYCFDTETGVTSFIATLSAGDRIDWKQWDQRPVQSTPDGRYLVFSSGERLTSDDTSGPEAPQLFEYDSESGRLVRVSIGEDHTYEYGGQFDGNTEEPQYKPEIPNLQGRESDLGNQAVEREQQRVLTDSGEVFFNSPDKLTEGAVSTGEGETVFAQNVYEYDPATENVYLISDGQDESARAEYEPATELAAVSLTGGNVFFQTPDQLVPQDGDTQLNLYDARVGGGFPAPVAPSGCGESCQSGGSPVPLLSAPTSASYTAGENLAPPTPPKASVKPKAKTLTRARKLARALEACAKDKPKSRRAACVKQARKRYGSQSKSKASSSHSRRGK